MGVIHSQGTVPFSLTDPAALNADITRQASMVAYINDFALMMVMSLGSCLLLMLLRAPPLSPVVKPVIAASGSQRPGPAD